MSHGLHRKRSRDTYENGIDTTISQDLANSNANANGTTFSAEKVEQDSGKWQTVEPRKKRRKKQAGGHNDPSITHSSHARLQSFVKIGDLQNLVLYFLAGGSAPQWCSVRHHNDVRKVVVLMVPGVEAGMFTGAIQLTPARTSASENTIEAFGDQSTASEGGNQNGKGPHNAGLDVSTTHASSEESRRRTNITPDDYYPVKLSSDRLPEPLQPLAGMFEHIWPVKTPGDDRHAKMHSPLAAMLISPTVKSKEQKAAKGPQFPPEGRNWKNQNTPIVSFLASPQELADENYVLHPTHYDQVSSTAEESARRETNHTTAAHGWLDLPVDLATVRSQSDTNGVNKTSLTAGRKVLAMDCEMCITSPKGVTPQVFSLTRISIINWDGQTVLDEFVKPAEPITDYLTPYSGITPELLENVTTTLSDIQSKLRDILTSDAILIGHSLNSDLNALRITFPYIVDTAFLYPHPRGPPLKSSLKWLSQKYLSREIQKGHGSTGHDSIEDARACLDLVKQKCEKGKTWGTSEANGESIFKRLARARKPQSRDSRVPDHTTDDRVGAVVDWGDPSRGYGSSAAVAIGCQNDDDVVKGVLRALTETMDDSKENGNGPPVKTAPSDGCDFVWARLRGLEVHRGWYSRSNPNSSNSTKTDSSPTTTSLAEETARSIRHIQEIYDSLPSCTAFIVYSGSGDPRELQKMQELQRTFKDEYRVKKWDQLSVKWTDTEEQQLKKACEKARKGCAFVTVKVDASDPL